MKLVLSPQELSSVGFWSCSATAEGLDFLMNATVTTGKKYRS